MYSLKFLNVLNLFQQLVHRTRDPQKDRSLVQKKRVYLLVAELEK